MRPRQTPTIGAPRLILMAVRNLTPPGGLSVGAIFTPICTP